MHFQNYWQPCKSTVPHQRAPLPQSPASHPPHGYGHSNPDREEHTIHKKVNTDFKWQVMKSLKSVNIWLKFQVIMQLKSKAMMNYFTNCLPLNVWIILVNLQKASILKLSFTHLRADLCVTSSSLSSITSLCPFCLLIQCSSGWGWPVTLQDTDTRSPTFTLCWSSEMNTSGGSNQKKKNIITSLW